VTRSVLIVDDSATARLVLRRIIDEHSGGALEVVAEAADRATALAALARHRPDMVAMDVHLGGDHGVEVTREMMRLAPLPIALVTGVNPGDAQLAFEAMQAGALEVLPKPPGGPGAEAEQLRRRLARALVALSEVPVVGHRFTDLGRPASTVPPRKGAPIESRAPAAILLGASTGGPPVLRQILQQLPAPCPLPVVIVQHIGADFVASFAHWLGSVSGHDVRLCTSRQPLTAGLVFVAPASGHLRFDGGAALQVVSAPPRRHYMPSIDELFESVPPGLGAAVIAGLLTGMGDDGVAGLGRLRQLGASTFAQDPESCAVDSMPGRAIAARAARRVLAPGAMGEFLKLQFARGLQGVDDRKGESP